MSISAIRVLLSCALPGAGCTRPYAVDTPTNLALSFHCRVDTCVGNNHVNAVAFRVTNDSDQDVWLHAWSLRPDQLLAEDLHDVNRIRMREEVAPPIPEFFGDYRLEPGAAYVLHCRYDGEMARPKRDPIPTYLTKAAVPSTRFTVCK
jgi:hypothetical protein